MAAMWTATAANASSNDPEAVISRAGDVLRHNGTNAGTSISPLPCTVAVTKALAARPPRRFSASSTAPHSPAPAASSGRPSIDPPHATNAATAATDAAWPTAMGHSAAATPRASRERMPQAAASAQPVQGLSPCSAPAPATASQGRRPAMPVMAQAFAPPQQAAPAGASS